MIAIFVDAYATIEQKRLQPPAFMSYPLFTQLTAVSPGKGVAGSGGADNGPSVGQMLQNCGSIDAANGIVQQAVRQKISSIMAIPPDSISLHKPLHAYGVDSLVAIELRAWVMKTMQVEMTVLDMLGQTSLSDFSAKITHSTSLLPLEVKLAGNEADA